MLRDLCDEIPDQEARCEIPSEGEKIGGAKMEAHGRRRMARKNQGKKVVTKNGKGIQGRKKPAAGQRNLPW